MPFFDPPTCFKTFNGLTKVISMTCFDALEVDAASFSEHFLRNENRRKKEEEWGEKASKLDGSVR
jgi:hypothetical protein